MFEELVKQPIRVGIKVYPAIPGGLDLEEIRRGWDRTNTFVEFVQDPYVNAHFRAFRLINLGLTDKAAESAFVEWVGRIYPDRPIHRDERLKQGDLLNF